MLQSYTFRAIYSDRKLYLDGTLVGKDQKEKIL